MKNFIKISLAVILLLCLFNMPYGYFQSVRFICFVSFSYLAFLSYKENQEKIAFGYGALALLFQPFFKIALGRGLWNVVDVVVAIALVISILRSNDK